MITNTFSVVALDGESGEIGIAVASKVLSVGAVVPWARAGVGAVATQAWTNAGFGPEGLRLLGEGLGAEETLKRLVESDQHRERRQVGIVDAQGRAAAWTGRKCTAWAGHREGRGYTCQGNILAGASVVDAMAEAVEGTGGPLPERLLAALEAGQARGGDTRGQQSVALVVVKEGAGPGGLTDRYIDLRVDDASQPIADLRRLLAMHRQLRPGQKVVDDFVIAAHGDQATVRALAERHPVLTQARARWDESAVEAAAHTGQREIAEFLLSRGAPLDICTAAMLGMTERVAAFLRDDPATAHAAGAHGIPVLFYPALTGQIDVADLLVRAGADVNVGVGGNTPLHGAALAGQAAMAAWLLDHGADIDARNYQKKTPLEVALDRGHGAVADLLRGRGATV